jgi:hypothetical protein
MYRQQGNSSVSTVENPTDGLPLVAFEQYMQADDRPQWPMNIYTRLFFDCRLDAEAADRALTTVYRRHRLLRSRTETADRRTPVWVDVDPLPGLRDVRGDAAFAPETRTESYVSYPPIGVIDPATDPALRLWLADGLHGDDVIFQIHHSATDGLGMFAAVEDWLTAYHHFASGAANEPSLKPIDPADLDTRGEIAEKPSDFCRWLGRQLISTQGAWQAEGRSIRALGRPLTERDVIRSANGTATTPVEPAAGPAPYRPAAVYCGFTADETAAVKETAKRCESTANDLLVALAFRSLAAWAERHDAGSSVAADDYIRIAMPFSLRNWRRPPRAAMNRVSMVFLDRRVEPNEALRPLVRSVNQEVELIRKRRLGWIFIYGLNVARRLPGGLAIRARTEAPSATAVFSNLGKFLAKLEAPKDDAGRVTVGGSALLGAEILPPVRPGTAFAMLPVTYAGKLTMSLRFDEHAVTRAQADDLIAEFRRQIAAAVEDAAGNRDG